MMQYFSPEANNAGIRKKPKTNQKDSNDLNNMMNKRYNSKTKKVPTPTPA
jgi:hypothetical protein